MKAQSVVRRFLAAEPNPDGSSDPYFFEKEDPEDKYSAGNLYYCAEDNTIFLTRRSGVMHHPYKWDIPGGRSEEGETIEETARRESEEELRKLPNSAIPVTVHTETWKKDGEDYHYYVFLYVISEEEKVRWTPKVTLDKESAGFKWFKLDEVPSKEKLHFDLSWVKPALRASKKKTASGVRFKLSFEQFKPRYEHKFWVSASDLPAIRDYIRPNVVADEHSLHYTIHNVYLDNQNLESFFEHSNPSHFKLRARTYDDRKDLFLEVKGKVDGICKKSRSVVPLNDLDAILRDANKIPPFFRFAMQRHSQPLVRLDYDREAYNAFQAEGRVTFDTNVRFAKQPRLSFTGSPKHVLLPPDKAILELKFSGAQPDFMGALIKDFGLVRVSISKYCLSVDRLLETGDLHLFYDYR